MYSFVGIPTPQYDIKSLARVSGDNADGIDASRDRVMGIIEKEVAGGIPLSRIVLGGFSQGAALSLFSGYQSKTVLGGVIAMSGYLPRNNVRRGLWVGVFM